MTETEKYKLKKPDKTDYAKIGALNDNADAIDAALAAQAAAAAEDADALASHLADEDNPHGVTAAQIGAIAAATLGQPGGPAQLGADGKLPADQLGNVGGGGSLLTLRFDAAFLGCTWTLTGGGETYSGTVGESLTATASVKGVETTYTLAAERNGIKTAQTFVTPAYFTAMTVKLEEAKVFGVCWDTSNSSTALTRLTPETDPYGYATQTVTAEPVPAVGTGAGSSPFDDFMPWAGMKECNLDANGTVTAWKGDSGFSRGAWRVMVYIPEFYFKYEESGSKKYFYISNREGNDFVKHPGSGKFVGRYVTAPNSAGTTTSVFSQTGGSAGTNITRANARTLAKENGEKFHLYDFATRCAIVLLYVVEFADWNCQTKIGRGIVDSNTGSLTSGATDIMTYHTGRGPGTDGMTGVQYRWIENLWGNVSQWVDGFNANGTTAYYCTDPSKYADDTLTGYTKIGTMSQGWIKDLTVTDDGLLIPKTAGGSATTYVPDHGTAASSGWHVPHSGGYYNGGNNPGLLYFVCNLESSASVSYISARLMAEP